MINILFTSVGRRVELIQAFRNAAEKIGVEITVFGADIDHTAPALMFCDHKLIVPRIRSDQYIPALKKICVENRIDGLIPTIDTDLLLLSQNRTLLEEKGTVVFISDSEKISICRDKRLTADYFISLGLKSPRPVDDYRKYTGGYPAFIKPKDGSSSIFAYEINNEEELKTYAERVPDYIVQPFIKGTEYTIDAFCDTNGKPVYITPRVRLAVRAGEVLKTEICQDERIIEEAKAVLADFKPRGAITIQLIRDDCTGEDYYIEINPRFGGGAPLSIMAGADSAEAVLRILCGENLSYIDHAAENKAVYSRFDQSIRVDK